LLAWADKLEKWLVGTELFGLSGMSFFKVELSILIFNNPYITTIYIILIMLIRHIDQVIGQVMSYILR